MEEGVGSARVCANLLGMIERNVNIVLFADNGTAIGLPVLS